MAATDQQILDAVNDAIFYIVNGGDYAIGKPAVQEYRSTNRDFRHVPLDKLYDMKKELEAKINGSRQGGTTNYAEFSRPQS
jgi:hypothetical protein